MEGKGVKMALTLPCYVLSNCKITLIANVKQSNFRSQLLFRLHRLATTLKMQNCQVYLRAGGRREVAVGNEREVGRFGE